MTKTIYLAGGCFWGVEAYYSRLKGVLETEVGYANGHTANPTYAEVKTGLTGHAETLKLVYDDAVLPLTMVIEHYLRFVDPYSLNKQGEDIGTQYRTGIYVTDKKEIKAVRSLLDEHLESGYKIEVGLLTAFYSAEDYHQDYLTKNPHGYCHVNLNLIRPDEKKN